MTISQHYPVPPDAHTLLLFGGTFDPPHRAHIELPIAARDAIGADWLMYIPAGRSPHKTRNPIAPDAARLAMLHAALEHIEGVSISTIEYPTESDVESRPPSYTVDTLERLHELAGTTTLRLLIGADQAASFHRWHKPERIIELAEPVVMLRAPHDDRADLLGTIREHWPDAEAARWERRIVDVPLIDVSATEVRRLLGEGALDDPGVREALPEAVLEIIKARGLYAGMD